MDYVTRFVEEEIVKTLNDSKIAILYGPRQVGKTTLALHIAEKLSDNYAYLNCDEPDVALALSRKTSTELIRYIGNKKVVVIDEAQRVEDIGLSLKLIADSAKGIKLIATGSSSFELANSINEPLTGRAYYFTIWPLGLSEISNDPVYLNRIVEDLLINGSYPVIALRQVSDIERYLSNLTNNYLYRDLLSFGVVRSEMLLTRLLRMLALQIGSEASISAIAKELKVDSKTVSRLIDLLEKAFVIYRLPPYTANQRSGLKKQNKIYFVDLGVRNYLIGNLNPISLRTDKGSLWENFCINELKKLQIPSSEPVNSYFWRNYAGAEVDYIEEKRGRIYPYEFKWSAKRLKLPKAFTVNSVQDLNVLRIIDRQNFSEHLSIKE